MTDHSVCPSCGRSIGELHLDDQVKCDHCYAATRRRLSVLAEFDGLQRVVVTEGARGFQLFINGNLQFSSSDEFIYHEGLVHPVICWCDRPSVRNVAILGGGDGLAAREVLRYAAVESVIVVDYDPVVTRIAKEHEAFRSLNKDAFGDPRLRLLNMDAVEWLNGGDDLLDAIIVDFPDPQRREYAELYTRSVFASIGRRLAPAGQFVVQATSFRQCPRSFWCIARTIEAAGFITVKYEVSMRSFGEWAFIIGRRTPLNVFASRKLPEGLRSISAEKLAGLPATDLGVPEEVIMENESNSGVLYQYFDEEWRRWVAALGAGPGNEHPSR